MNTPATDPPDDDVNALAGEYVLGLLDAAGVARAARLRGGDGRFEAALRGWESRLMPLAETLEPVAPPARLWQGIAAAITPKPAPKQGLWNSLAFWRYFGLGAGGLGAFGMAAAALALFLHTTPSPVATATLATPADGVFLATARQSGGETTLLISPAMVTIPAHKSAELWLINPGAAPKPLGLLAGDHPVTLTFAGDDLTTAALAISIEPEGGSPTGAVTGPVIASARFSQL